MQEAHDFLVPDYVQDFHCKMGACRHACCTDWPIAISMADYFRLLSIPCSPSLRQHLDVALHLCDHPTEERYAQICPRYDGNCPMRSPDGRCVLHSELGEDFLPSICRLYPRGIRSNDSLECSCANSCEAVLELFLHREAPIRFITQTFQLSLPEKPLHTVQFETLGHEQEIRLHFIHIIQNRKLSLPARLLALGDVLLNIQKALKCKDIQKVQCLLARPSDAFDVISMSDTDSQLRQGLDVMERMMQQIDEHSRSIHDFGETALNGFRRYKDPVEYFLLAKYRFETTVPNWEIVFEHMLVNHMFFEGFPFQDRPVELDDEFIGLCAIYAMLRFLCFGWLAEHPSQEAFIDVSAAAFRLIDHTAFAQYASKLLRQLNFYCPQDLCDLIKL